MHNKLTKSNSRSLLLRTDNQHMSKQITAYFITWSINDEWDHENQMSMVLHLMPH